jgi:hypothetical protein
MVVAATHNPSSAPVIFNFIVVSLIFRKMRRLGQRRLRVDTVDPEMHGMGAIHHQDS